MLCVLRTRCSSHSSCYRSDSPTPLQAPRETQLGCHPSARTVPPQIRSRASPPRLHTTTPSRASCPRFCQLHPPTRRPVSHSPFPARPWHMPGVPQRVPVRGATLCAHTAPRPCAPSPPRSAVSPSLRRAACPVGACSGCQLLPAPAAGLHGPAGLLVAWVHAAAPSAAGARQFQAAVPLRRAAACYTGRSPWAALG